MTDPKARVLRVTGVPREMASAAVDALLTTSRGVLSIDAVEASIDDPGGDAVHVVVEEAQAERVRLKLTTSFAGVAVEDVTDARAAGQAPSERIRAATAPGAVPALALEPMAPHSEPMTPRRKRP